MEHRIDAAPQATRPIPRHGVYPRSDTVPPQGRFAPTGKFGRMFPDLRPLVCTDADLEQLGKAMLDETPDGEDGDNKKVPQGFTYLGQFVDHDITFDPTSLQETLVDPQALRNFRTPMLDLDSLYGSGPVVHPFLYARGVPNEEARFEIGVTKSTPGGGDATVPPSLPHDLPRGPQRFAIIGDPRNDENLAVAQLHLAFLKFHNKVVDGLTDGSIPRESPLRKSIFEEARDLVIWHYQWIVLYDFLGRILDRNVLQDILTNGRRFYLPKGEDAFMPVEFSVAAYRLGHSMVRNSYDYNRVFTFRPGGVTPATLELLFRFSGLSGGAVGDVPIPSDWIIDWRRFFEVGKGAKVGFTRKLNAHWCRRCSAARPARPVCRASVTSPRATCSADGAWDSRPGRASPRRWGSSRWIRSGSPPARMARSRRSSTSTWRRHCGITSSRRPSSKARASTWARSAAGSSRRSSWGCCRWMPARSSPGNRTGSRFSAVAPIETPTQSCTTAASTGRTATRPSRWPTCWTSSVN